jgi:hypothetical protein
MLLPILCLTQVGCDTPAGRAVTADEDIAKPHLSRGGPRNGHLWVVYPNILAQWVREIPEIAEGTPAEEVIKRLGEPDEDYICAPETFFPSFFPDRGFDRWVEYYVAMDKWLDGLPNSSTNLTEIESIALVFGPDDRYKTYWVENPLHRRKLNTAPGAPITPDELFDHDLTSLMRAGPAASTEPTLNQTSH